LEDDILEPTAAGLTGFCQVRAVRVAGPVREAALERAAMAIVRAAAEMDFGAAASAVVAEAAEAAFSDRAI
jgi:hypothetical protein